MTSFDYVVLIIFLASMMLGAWRGVLGEIIAVAAWVLAFLAAKWWGDEFARQLLTGIGDPVLRLVVAWVLIMVFVLLLMSMVRLAVRGLLKTLGLAPSDRALGLLFGAARGGLIVLVLVALGGMLSLSGETWWRGAYLSAPLETAVLACKPWLPPEVANRIRFR
ncbi:MAG: CvpA family protein [Candidatus Accumulibacter sp.]|jgi:membrane protein required for colicin V production|nr:CvpA family protein [Accumulibacter sp.]